jgi:hypothetical protein
LKICSKLIIVQFKFCSNLKLFRFKTEKKWKEKMRKEKNKVGRPNIPSLGVRWSVCTDLVGGQHLPADWGLLYTNMIGGRFKPPHTAATSGSSVGRGPSDQGNFLFFFHSIFFFSVFLI